MSAERLTTADIARPQPAQTRGPEPPPVRPHDPAVAADRPAPPPRNDGPDDGPLLPRDAVEPLRDRWGSIQTGFVDEPRRAVEQADNLVAEAMKHLAETFAAERARIEQQWDRGDQVTTEDLRVILQRYRSFFHRLLAV